MSDAPRPATLLRPAFDGASLAATVGGTLVHDGGRPIRGAAVDSRRVAAGNVFFALPGERTDGHEFLEDAVRRGATALVVTRPPSAGLLDRLAGAAAPTIIRVPDGLAALHAAAGAWRDRFTPLVVGVTGSLAKTSTKEQVAEVLAERWTVLRSEGNENNEIGLPLTLLRLAPEHQVAVLEMGMYVVGDIAALSALSRPSVGVVTAVRGTHLSRAGSLAAIERGKRELVEALPAGGTAVLNFDDPLVAGMAAAAPPGVRVIGYGFGPSAEVTAHGIHSRGADGMRFVLRTPAGEAAIDSPALGRHSVHNALAGAAVGIAAGLELDEIARGLARPLRLEHRSTLLDLGPWRVLDDSYNAAPDSMAAALELLAGLPGRRIAVLGEMLELGPATIEAHRRVGAAARGRADLLVAVGPTAGDYAAGARAAGMAVEAIVETPDLDAALRELLARLRPGDVMLLKGSRGAALDTLIAPLRAAAAPGASA